MSVWNDWLARDDAVEKGAYSNAGWDGCVARPRAKKVVEVVVRSHGKRRGTSCTTRVYELRQKPRSEIGGGETQSLRQQRDDARRMRDDSLAFMVG